LFTIRINSLLPKARAAGEHLASCAALWAFLAMGEDFAVSHDTTPVRTTGFI
jgi:hypothetical protein